jgi:hypothetical protein
VAPEALSGQPLVGLGRPPPGPESRLRARPPCRPLALGVTTIGDEPRTATIEARSLSRVMICHKEWWLSTRRVDRRRKIRPSQGKKEQV